MSFAVARGQRHRIHRRGEEHGVGSRGRGGRCAAQRRRARIRGERVGESRLTSGCADDGRDREGAVVAARHQATRNAGDGHRLTHLEGIGGGDRHRIGRPARRGDEDRRRGDKGANAADADSRLRGHVNVAATVFGDRAHIVEARSAAQDLHWKERTIRLPLEDRQRIAGPASDVNVFILLGVARTGIVGDEHAVGVHQSADAVHTLFEDLGNEPVSEVGVVDDRERLARRVR